MKENSDELIGLPNDIDLPALGCLILTRYQWDNINNHGVLVPYGAHSLVRTKAEFSGKPIAFKAKKSDLYIALGNATAFLGAYTKAVKALEEVLKK
jgi:hypothetical protein